MKKIIIAATLLAASAGTASAADWTGFYVGANVGYAGDNFEYPVTVDLAPIDVRGQVTLNSSGFIGGAQVGYDHQFSNRWVLGIEADYDSSDVTGEVAVSGGATGIITGGLSASAGSQLESLATVRLRLGYAYNDRVMPYVTAGAAFGSVSTSYAAQVTSGGSTLFSATGSKSSDQSGWAAGLGVEYNVGDRVSLKTEYLFTDLGEYNLIDAALLGGTAKLDVSTTAHAIRFGVNYRFD